MKVKQGMEENYKKSCTYTGDPKEFPQPDYFQAIVDAGEAVGCALDEGKTPEEAIKELNGRDLTGYMAGIAADVVAHFNPRGEELRSAWNKRYGGKGNEKGTINPAIITLKD